MNRAILMAGVPAANQALYHRIRFVVGDSAAYIQLRGDRQLGNESSDCSTLFVRDIELARARRLARADEVVCAADFAPTEGLSGDRDTALAQAVAEFFARSSTTEVQTDRTLPFVFAWHLQQREITVTYDAELGVLERRMKDAEELNHLRQAQAATEEAMEMACRWIGQAAIGSDDQLVQDGEVLTSERVQRRISVFLLERGYSNHHGSIVATVPHVSDCHHHGTGPLRTGLPVIIDIFPRSDATRYWGDCTRTVVHGRPTERLVAMHAAVVEAKAAAIGTMRPGITGQQVHEATAAVITSHGFAMGAAPVDADDHFISMRHGTGHGIGLDVHEPILLDKDAPALLAGEVLTVEPGLYGNAVGGVRVEDMVAVTDDGTENFNRLPEGLSWE